MKKLSISIEEQEHLFHTELVNVGVDFWKAAKVAKILALGQLDEQLDERLTAEEHQLVQEVCAHWLAQRNRLAFISQVSGEVQIRKIEQPHSSIQR